MVDLSGKRRTLSSKLTAVEAQDHGKPASPSPSMPSSADIVGVHGRRSSWSSLRRRTNRSLSGRPSLSGSVTSLDRTSTNSRSRRLSKPRPSSSAGPGALQAKVDWKRQQVEGMAALQSPPQPLVPPLRAKSPKSPKSPPQLVVTSEYIVKTKCLSDATALFPQLSTDGEMSDPGPPPEPVLFFPITSIVSVFRGEGTQPVSGLKICWKKDAAMFHQTTLCFGFPAERDAMMDTVCRLVRNVPRDAATLLCRAPDVVELTKDMQSREEPNYCHVHADIFPVVPRGGRSKPVGAKEDDNKMSRDTPGSYLAIGAHFCFLLSVRWGKAGRITSSYEKFGLMTLDRVEGTLVVHEERFTLTFCEPFQRPVRLELASRFRRQIIILLGRADRFLKPRWPVTWQTYETFRAVQGYTEAVDLVAQEDFGALKRTLDAYLAAYSCDAVEWEVNWKTRFPEFRLLRSEKGEGYSCLQLLAVMRALRFNDYFQSLSFRDVDLGVLRNRFDQGPMTSPVGWFNQGGMVLDEDERAELSQSSVLHQELHALAFCSSAIRQLDLAYALRHTCLSSDQQGQWTGGRSSCLAPIWNLLKGGCTRCNNLILAGNSLSATDVLELGNALRMGLIQGLDVAHCGLDDASLTYLARAMMVHGANIQRLKLACNSGRIPAGLVPRLLDAFSQLRELNLCGTIQGCIEGPLVPFDALWQLPKLRELDLTHAKVNEATLSDLERFLVHRRRAMKDGKPSEFQHLVLVNCGITGARACRLFNAIGEKRGMHLFLNSNPLEQGVEQLADAIRCSRGPAGLSMEMVEFRHEANFARLMNALAETKHMSFLSLVGTAPVPRLDRACSPSTVSALENFFSHNQSVRFLDFSGIRGRLEEGQMGRGFGRSVRSLRQNTTLTWLRLRNQNLHDDVGALGIVIEDNDTLETLDCQENNLNMTSLQFLVDSLGKNRRITGFPLSRAERERIWQSIVASLAQAASSSNKKAQSLRQQQQRDLLRSVFDRTLAELDEHLARNRAAAQAASARLLPSGDEADSRDDTTPVEETWTPTGALGGSCAFPGPESGRERADDGDEGGDGDDGSTPKAGPPRRPTIRGSTIAVDLLDSAPLQAQDEEGDGMERAVDLPDATRSEFSTPPPGLASPVTPEHVVYPGVIQA